MQKSETFEQRSYYIGDGDYLDAYMKVFHHKCAACCIKVSKDENRKEMKWTLPDNLKPTEKQVSYATTIANRLRKDISELVTRKQYSKFISDNVERFKQEKQKDYNSALHEYAIELDGDLLIHPDDMDMLLKQEGEWIAYSDKTSDNAVLIKTNENGNVVSFSRENPCHPLEKEAF